MCMHNFELVQYKMSNIKKTGWENKKWNKPPISSSQAEREKGTFAWLIRQSAIIAVKKGDVLSDRLMKPWLSCSLASLDTTGSYRAPNCSQSLALRAASLFLFSFPSPSPVLPVQLFLFSFSLTSGATSLMRAAQVSSGEGTNRHLFCCCTLGYCPIKNYHVLLQRERLRAPWMLSMTSLSLSQCQPKASNEEQSLFFAAIYWRFSWRWSMVCLLADTLEPPRSLHLYVINNY